MFKNFFFILSLSFFLFISCCSFADVIFEWDFKGGDAQSSDKTDVSIKGNNLRMDFYHNGNKSGNSMIFLGDREELIFLNHTGKSYFVMNKESMNSMAGNINQAMSKMKDALKNAPPEQRAMMERMMKGRLGAMQTPHIEEPVLKKVGFEKIDGYKCTKYETYRGDEMVRLHYVTRWKNIDGGSEISSVMLGMGDFMDEWRKTFANRPKFIGSSMPSEKGIFKQLRKLDGFPVKTVNFFNGAIVGETTFSSVVKTNVDPLLFDPPEGYKKRDMKMPFNR